MNAGEGMESLSVRRDFTVKNVTFIEIVFEEGLIPKNSVFVSFVIKRFV